MKTFYTIFALMMAGLLVSCGGMGGYGDQGPGGWGPMMHSGFGFGGMFMWILLVIVIGVVAYFIIQNIRAKTTGGATQETPLDILKKRYAKGEISKEDFDRMKRDLET
jgi:putative membrane protein